MKQTNHPYIHIDSNTRGKHPIIAGTGIRVIDIAIEYQYKGYSIDQIIDYHPHLQLKQVHNALSYYYENQDEMDRKIREQQQLANELRKKALKLSTQLEADYA